MKNNFIQGTLTPNDMGFILNMPEFCPNCEQILVTGEIAINRLEDEDILWFIKLNSLQKQTLFLLTEERKTAMMTRYEPRLVWNYIPPARRAELFMAECRRFGVGYWSAERPDFYEGVFEANKMYGKYVVLDNLDDTLYVNSVLLFRKPFAFGIRMTRFFADFSFAGTELRSLPETQETRRREVWNKEDEMLTNDEMVFLHELYKAGKADEKIVRFPGSSTSLSGATQRTNRTPVRRF